MILLLTLIFCVGVTAADKNKSVTLSVSGMTCESCANTVEKALKKVDGVKEVKVNLSGKTATVVLASTKATTASLIKAVSDAGFSASTGKSTTNAEMKKKKGDDENCGDGCCDDESGSGSKPKKESKKS